METVLEQPPITHWEERRFSLLRNADLPATAKLVALTLLDHEGTDGYVCNITHHMLSQFLGVHQPNVSRSLLDLRDRKILNWFIPEVPERFGSHGNRNVYYFVGEYAHESRQVG